MRTLVDPGAMLEKLWTGAVWSEGLVWWENGSFTRTAGCCAGSPAPAAPCFASRPTTPMVTREIARVGWYPCEHSGRHISRTGRDGTVVALVDRYQGMRVNSPNNVVVNRMGRSGSPILPTASFPTMKALKPRVKSAPATSIASIRPQTICRSSPTISTGRTAWRFRPTKVGSTSQTPAFRTALEGHGISGCLTWSMAAIWRAAGSSAMSGPAPRTGSGTISTATSSHPPMTASRPTRRTAAGSARSLCPRSSPTAHSAVRTATASSSPPRRRSTPSTSGRRGRCEPG